jgi:hypothetical protein
MTFEETAAKFRGCAEYANWPKTKADKIITLVSSLENVTDMSAFGPLLSAAEEQS